MPSTRERSTGSLLSPWLREELLVTIRNAVQRYELICGNTQLRQEVQTQNVQLQKEHLAQQNLIRELEQKTARAGKRRPTAHSIWCLN